MKQLLLVLTVTLLLAQANEGTQCWGSSGKCRQTCKETEVFYILCQDGNKCCVNPKYVPAQLHKEN
ncbi:beta-defensin 121-like [Dipodomys merriami]|uniref:beta-defensin 121-like n=1 Tax=Dipodomys merriami TaxID=94247 RepID=UPI003855E840